MASVSSVSLTGNAYIDGLLTGVKWGVASLTYSFPTSSSYYAGYPSNEPTNAFAAFTAAQQQAMTKVLANYAAVSNLTFTKVTESSSTSGILRFAQSNAISTAMSYYPSTMDRGGDSWFNHSNNYYSNPQMGNYAYSIMLHEAGHTLGLKHPQDVFGSFGLLPSSQDALPYTVMSYRSYVGGSLSYSNAATSYPETLMMDDIRAVQTLYGANYTNNSGNTVYSWNPTTGTESINGVAQTAPAGNKIFMTLWDGGGTDTYNFSNYTTALKVDLNPGAWTTTSATQLASLGTNHNAPGTIANAYLFGGNAASLIENAVGGTAADVITGNQANNQLTGGAGNDTLDGSMGTDTAVYSGSSSQYHWTHNSDGSWSVADLRSGSPDGTDKLINMEKLQFTDVTITLGTTSSTTSTSTTSSTSTAANTAPVITSSAPSWKITEWADGSTNEANNVTHKASGKITFADPDLTDIHVASFVAEASGYLGTFKLGTLNETSDSVTWSYAIPDSTMDFLGAGQSLVQKYDLTISDGHGGIATQTATIILVGTSDAGTSTTSTSAGGPPPPSEPQALGHPGDHFAFHSLAHPEASDWLLL